MENKLAKINNEAIRYTIDGIRKNLDGYDQLCVEEAFFDQIHGIKEPSLSPLKFNIEERRLLLFLAAESPNFEDCNGKWKFKIYISNYLKFWKDRSDGKDHYDRVWNALWKLYIASVKFYHPIQKEHIVTHWVDAMGSDKKQTYISAYISSEVKLLLHYIDAKRTEIPLENVKRLPSETSIRLYEILKSYASMKKKEFTIEELKSLMHMPASRYKKHADFVKKTIEPALKAISEKTDIKIKCSKPPNKKQWTSILFRISRNAKPIQPELQKANYDFSDAATPDSFEKAQKTAGYKNTVIAQKAKESK